MTKIGKVTVPVTIDVDITRLIEELQEAISDSIEGFEEDEYFFDEDNNLVFKGEFSSPCKLSYSQQTRYEPTEYNYEADCGEFYGIEVEKSVEDEIKKLIKDLKLADIVNISAHFDENFEFDTEDYEPDPDTMPGGWDWLKDHEGDESYESRGDWLKFEDDDLRG